MQIQLSWDGGMRFTSHTRGLQTPMDAKKPFGQDTAMTPKELVAAGLGGCTAMDVAGLLKKHHQVPDFFSISVEIETKETPHPAVFTKATILFEAKGNIEPKIFHESVVLSQTRYCGVSAMLAQAFPIFYKVVLNGIEVGSGKANFSSGSVK